MLRKLLKAASENYFIVLVVTAAPVMMVVGWFAWQITLKVEEIFPWVAACHYTAASWMDTAIFYLLVVEIDLLLCSAVFALFSFIPKEVGGREKNGVETDDDGILHPRCATEDWRLLLRAASICLVALTLVVGRFL